jgi:hypothetical protein
MPLETLSYQHSFTIPDVPDRWLPLIHLYDPDLPLFPIYYFHALRPNLPQHIRPLSADRIFGYVERIIPRDHTGIEVRVVTNKQLTLPSNAEFIAPLEAEVRARFGMVDPVRQTDVGNVFQAPLEHANPVLRELWYRVVANAYGNLLPFGRTWDEVFGLARFVASWNSQSGRKGELIQTHYFSSRFGARIGAAAGIPQLDFFLLPTLSEVLDPENPLTDFPAFRELVGVAQCIAENYGQEREVGDLKLTAFQKPEAGQFNTAQLLNIINGAAVPHNLRDAAIECFNAFGKGPPRTILFLLMLHDLRNGLLRPESLTSAQFGSIYDGLDKSYQSPKVIAIYAQQCFGNREGMPVDTWIQTFMKWPLTVFPKGKTKTPMTDVFTHAHGLGKVERLLWVASQARKVHSSACDDAVWCVKYGSPAEDPQVAKPRGANPFACNICFEPIRNQCPAYAAIREQLVAFNTPESDATFLVNTSAGNNADTNQTFVRCEGESIYGVVKDEFSPADVPTGFNTFPAAGHDGSPITVADFVQIY